MGGKRSFEGGEVETKRKSEFRMTQSAPPLDTPIVLTTVYSCILSSYTISIDCNFYID